MTLDQKVCKAEVDVRALRRRLRLESLSPKNPQLGPHPPNLSPRPIHHEKSSLESPTGLKVARPCLPYLSILIRDTATPSLRSASHHDPKPILEQYPCATVAKNKYSIPIILLASEFAYFCIGVRQCWVSYPTNRTGCLGFATVRPSPFQRSCGEIT